MRGKEREMSNREKVLRDIRERKGCQCYLQEAGQFCLHEFFQLLLAQCVAVTILVGIAMEHRDQGLHGTLQLRRHGCREKDTLRRGDRERGDGKGEKEGEMRGDGR